MEITILIQNDYGDIPSELIYSLSEIIFFSHQSRDIFLDENTWFSLIEDSRLNESIIISSFESNFRSSFLFIVKSLYLGKVASLTDKDNIKDITNLCLNIGLISFIKVLSIDVDTLFEFRLNKLDRKIVTRERQLRKKLFSSEEIDFRHEDKFFLLENVLNNDLLPEEEKSFISGKIIFSEKTLYPMIYSDKILPFRKITFETIEDVCNTGRENFTRVLEHLNLNFDGTFVIAGGSADMCLRDNYVSPRHVVDIDIFFITKNPEEAKKSIHNNISRILENSERKLILRTQNSITVQCYIKSQKRGFKKYKLTVQFILRLYNSIAQVISGFDIDASCAAYDGKNFYVMPRYLRAVNKGYILADPERQSETYAQRMIKYYKRRFDIAFPGYDELRVVNPREGIDYIVKKIMISYLPYNVTYISDYDNSSFNICKNIFSSCIYASNIYFHNREKILPLKGLKNISRTYLENHHRNIKVPVIMTKSITKIFTGEETLEEKKLFNEEIFSLPKYGPNVEIDRSEKIKYLNNELVFESDLGPLSFKTKNPGTQLTNSFKPIFSDWYKKAYIREIKKIKPLWNERTLKDKSIKHSHKINIFKTKDRSFWKLN